MSPPKSSGSPGGLERQRCPTCTSRSLASLPSRPRCPPSSLPPRFGDPSSGLHPATAVEPSAAPAASPPGRETCGSSVRGREHRGWKRPKHWQHRCSPAQQHGAATPGHGRAIKSREKETGVKARVLEHLTQSHICTRHFYANPTQSHHLAGTKQTFLTSLPALWPEETEVALGWGTWGDTGVTLGSLGKSWCCLQPPRSSRGAVFRHYRLFPGVPSHGTVPAPRRQFSASAA